MKSYIYLLLLALALPSVPSANAGQAEDPELLIARQVFDNAMSLDCIPPPYYFVQCLTYAGGTAEVRFSNNTGEIIAQAVQDGSFPREWRVHTLPLSCGSIVRGQFDSIGQGFHPWKRDILDFCAACVDNPDCLSSIQP